MSNSIHQITMTAMATLLLAGCFSSPVREQDSMARVKLTQLQADSGLGSRAPVAINEAEAAVVAAETASRRDKSLATHLEFMANRKVDIAWARARTELLEDQRKTLAAHHEAVRLDARTREADAAHNDATKARHEAKIARQQTDIALLENAAAEQRAGSARADADSARGEAENARLDSAAAKVQVVDAHNAAAASRQQSDELQRRIDELNARESDRGLVVTLGDVLFSTGRSEFRGGAPVNLNRLASFLNKYPERTVVIEGHTDDVGSMDSNLGLSQRRADAVKAVLVAGGVDSSRVLASGKGENSPVADNNSDTGRQQNRRVEVIISNSIAKQAALTVQ